MFTLNELSFYKTFYNQPEISQEKKVQFEHIATIFCLFLGLCVVLRLQL